LHNLLICNGYNVSLPYTRKALPLGRSIAKQINQTLGRSGTAIAYEEVLTEFGEFSCGTSSKRYWRPRSLRAQMRVQL
jgi:hypothetical protein